MSVGQFAASLLFGVLSVLLPIVLLLLVVAVCVYVARWWIGRNS